MSDVNLPAAPSPRPSGTRTAVLALGGLAIAGIGLATGLLLRPALPSAPQDSAPVATVATPTPGPAATAVPHSARQQATRHAAATPRTNASDDPVRQPSPLPERRVSNDGYPAPRDLQPTQSEPVCDTCGVVESVRAVQRRGQGSGLGVVAGGALGGVVGHQMGKGSGNTVMTVLGAIGGGLLGNEIEKQQRSETVYETRIRMDDGTVRTLTQTTPATPGARIDLRTQTGQGVGSAPQPTLRGEPRAVRTSGDNGV